MRISDWSSDVCSSDLATFDRYDNAIFNAPATDGGGGLIQTVGSAAGSRIPMTQKFVGTLATTYRRELGGLNVALTKNATYNGGYNFKVVFAHQDRYLLPNRAEERRGGTECVNRVR